MAHLRKISLEEAQAISAAKAAETGSDLSAYAVGAMFSAVQVGATETDLYFHVNKSDSESLPGESLGQYEDLAGADADAVLEATYEAEEDFEGETVAVVRRVKVGAVPAGVETIETGLIPHRFA